MKRETKQHVVKKSAADRKGAGWKAQRKTPRSIEESMYREQSSTNPGLSVE